MASSIPKIELIDWSERYPTEDSRTIAIRQSTYCSCGPGCRQSKEIGKMTCKEGK